MDSPSKDFQKTLYRIAQVLAIGSGIHCNSSVGQSGVVDVKAFPTGVGLGASLSDYYWVDSCDYSFGSGFSTKMNLTLTDVRTGLKFRLAADNYYLFTWKGYDSTRDLHEENLKMLNAQGDKGFANVGCIETEFGYQSKLGWNLSIASSYIFRSTYYEYHPLMGYSTFEFSLKAGFHI